MIRILKTYDNENLFVVNRSENELLSILNKQKFIQLSFGQGGIAVSSIKRYKKKVLNEFEKKICSSNNSDLLDKYVFGLIDGKKPSASACERMLLSYNKNQLGNSDYTGLEKLKKTKKNLLISSKK